VNQTIERLFLLAALAIGLSCAWLSPLDEPATRAVDSGFKRALVSFASARTLNAVLSVAQSFDLSAKPFGLGASLTVGQALHPINQLVAQFAELMLAASVAFGAMKVLIAIGAYKGISILLSITTLCFAWLRWHGKPSPSLLSKILLVLVLIRFAVPVVSLGSQAVFDQFLVAEYNSAQHGIPTTDIKSQLPNPMQIGTYVNNWRQFAERSVEHIISLIVVFFLQTLVVPLFFFWLLYRICSAMLESPPRNNNQALT